MRKDQKQLIFILAALLVIFFIIRSMGPTDAVTPVWQTFGKTAASENASDAQTVTNETASDETTSDETSAAAEDSAKDGDEAPQPAASPAADPAPADALTAEYTFRTPELRLSHFTKHGIDMGFTTEEAYEEAASRVITNPGALHKTEAEDGDDVYYIEDTNEFVVLSTDGYIRTYFNPDNGKAYFDKQ